VVREWGLRLLRVAGLLCAFAEVAPAHGVEYRLQVANMWESGFTSFVRPGELGDGASGPGLDRLVARLDRGDLSKGPLLADRTLRWTSEAEARTFGAVRIVAEIKPGGEGNRQWDEVKGDGKPGERNVWVVSPSGPRPAAGAIPCRPERNGPSPSLRPVRAGRRTEDRDGTVPFGVSRVS
jgi:hypothetical protein